MNIPVVSELEIPPDPCFSGKTVIVDGFTGIVYMDPDKKTEAEFAIKKEKICKEKNELDGLRGKDNRTIDGRVVEVFANIGNQADVHEALDNDAGGIGLLRSEFLYIERQSCPDEETLFAAYRTVASQMKGRTVIIRTMDIGADKKTSWLALPSEENPALGLRAIRLSLTHKDLFRTQIRAILRASAFGSVAIMFPMIISMEELRQAKALLAEIKQKFLETGTAYDFSIPCGIMIETPAAALISDKLARECDFFSIGTNDLSQYTLAIDRQNPSLSAFFDPHHEAILKLIQLTIRNAHKAGIKAGICGELGADLSLTETFLKMGIDEFSVAPSSVLPLRRTIRKSHAGATG